MNIKFKLNLSACLLLGGVDEVTQTEIIRMSLALATAHFRPHQNPLATQGFRAAAVGPYISQELVFLVTPLRPLHESTARALASWVPQSCKTQKMSKLPYILSIAHCPRAPSP